MPLVYTLSLPAIRRAEQIFDGSCWTSSRSDLSSGNRFPSGAPTSILGSDVGSECRRLRDRVPDYRGSSQGSDPDGGRGPLRRTIAGGVRQEPFRSGVRFGNGRRHADAVGVALVRSRSGAGGTPGSDILCDGPPAVARPDPDHSDLGLWGGSGDPGSGNWSIGPSDAAQDRTTR